MIRYWIVAALAGSLSACNDVSEAFSRYDYENALLDEEVVEPIAGYESVEPSESPTRTPLSATDSRDQAQASSLTSLPPGYDSAFPETDSAKLAMLRKYKMVPSVKGDTVHDRVSVVVLREGMESSEEDRGLTQVDVWRLSREMYEEECEAGDSSSCSQAMLMQNLIGCAHQDEGSCTAARAEFQRD